ncbi:hypothetical protein BC833DRAFT_613721, partial [Globomyces pollinis-pini]
IFFPKLKMYRFPHNFKRFSTGTQQKQTVLEHLNTNGKDYSIMVGLIAASLGGLNYLMGLQMIPLQVEIHGIKEELKELRIGIKGELKELRIQIKDSEQRQDKNMKELKSLLAPLVVQVEL